MTQVTGWEERSEQQQQLMEQLGNFERQAEHLFFRAVTMLNKINEEMIMGDRSQAMARSNISRACTEAAVYAKREAAALRNRMPTE